MNNGWMEVWFILLSVQKPERHVFFCSKSNSKSGFRWRTQNAGEQEAGVSNKKFCNKSRSINKTWLGLPTIRHSRAATQGTNSSKEEQNEQTAWRNNSMNQQEGKIQDLNKPRNKRDTAANKRWTKSKTEFNKEKTDRQSRPTKSSRK